MIANSVVNDNNAIKIGFPAGFISILALAETLLNAFVVTLKLDEWELK